MTESCAPRAAPSPGRMLACPECDLLLARREIGPGERARCSRCGHLLFSPRPEAAAKIVALSLTVAILMGGAMFFPFLSVATGGVSHESSIFGTALAYSEGFLAPLSVAVMLLIVLLPVARVLALIFALGPLAAGRAPFAQARRAFRLAGRIRPWAMAEVFLIGTVVAIVKIGGLASVGLGPAFWAFALLVVAAAAMDSLTNDWTIWDALDPTSPL
ncbi:paraquat-inducible protein A [Solirhodobacter olei]|uniref:paraquat-inducible protein A n=1 Tax=Solirhodobacter olei TaxID=2493082 RepID=UPI000FD9B57F|nr:paraquat-inducible protein A [Solirhodobacter olei]